MEAVEQTIMENDMKGGGRDEEEKRKEEVLIELRRKLKGSYTELRLCLEALDKLFGKC